MTYSVILHVSRKPGISFEQFKHHWETMHIPLLKSLVGHDFPLSYTRHYIERPIYSPPSSPPVDPNLDKTETSDINSRRSCDIDAIAVLTFASKEHFERFSVKLSNEKSHALYKGDLGAFMDMAALKAQFAVSCHNIREHGSISLK